MSAVADTLREARALIDTPEKWCQGAATKGHQRCLVNALCACPPMAPNLKALRRAIGPVPVTLAGWNDRPGRTHAEVMAAFDKAIEAAS